MEQQTIIFVIGMPCNGKSEFIKKILKADEKYRDFEFLDVFQYEKRNSASDKEGAYIDVKAVVDAYYELRDDIQKKIQDGKSLVVEHTLFKHERRVEHVSKIRKKNPNVKIILYQIQATNSLIQKNYEKRNMKYNRRDVLERAAFMDPVTKADGFDEVYVVRNSEAGFDVKKIEV